MSETSATAAEPPPAKGGRPHLRDLMKTYGAYLGALMVRGLEMVGKFGLYMLAARILGAHEAGLFFLCMTWTGLMATIARAGFEMAVMRHVAAELAIGRRREAMAALLTGMGWTTVGGIAGALVTLVLAGPLALHLFSEPDLVWPLTLAAAAILPQALCILMGYALSGFNWGVSGQFVQNALWPALTLAAVGLGVRSLEGMLIALAASYLAAAVFGMALIVLRRRAIVSATFEGQHEEIPALWRTALPLGVVEVVQVSLNSLPVLVLGAFADAAAVGAFSVASRISLLISVLVVSIGIIAAPSFAALHRRGEIEALGHMNRRMRLVVALCGIPAVAVMMAVPGTLLDLIGPGFDTAATALMIMGLGQLVYCLLPNQDVMLSMTGHGSLLRWLNVAQFASCCVLAAILVPLFGMNGAAALTALVVAQGSITTALGVRRLLPGVF